MGSRVLQWQEWLSAWHSSLSLLVWDRSMSPNHSFCHAQHVQVSSRHPAMQSVYLESFRRLKKLEGQPSCLKLLRVLASLAVEESSMERR
jgi:hypothetical protein